MKSVPALKVRRLLGYAMNGRNRRTPIWRNSSRFTYSPLESILREGKEGGKKDTGPFLLKEVFPTLEVYFELTQLCNFNCPGCAVGLDAIPMNCRFDLTQEDIISWTNDVFEFAKQNGFSKIKVKYAGGEPLLPNAQNLIHLAHSLIAKKRKEMRIDVDEVIITNGSLLARAIPFIKKHALRVNVSFWGYGEGNDTERRTRRATFPHIIEGIKTALKASIPVSLTYVITASNGRQLPPFIRMLYDKKNPSWIGSGLVCDYPLPLHIAFFRPQNLPQYTLFRKTKGYKYIVEGVRAGIDTFLSLMKSNNPLPSFATMFDYLDFDTAFTKTCGSGSNYIAIGSRGASKCHEGLRTNDITKDIMADSQKLIMVEKNSSLNLRNMNPMDITLRLHGGMGCPRVKEIEMRAKADASYSDSVYRPIVEEILSLQSQRIRIE